LKTWLRRLLVALAVVILGAVLAGAYLGLRAAAVGTAYVAKIMCSGVFVAQRDPQSIRDSDLSGQGLEEMRYMDARVDREARRVTSTLFGLVSRQAVYREGRGCSVVHGEQPAPGPATGSARPAVDGFNVAARPSPAMEAALAWAFAEPDPALPRGTRAIVVLHKGRMVAERYAPGFTQDTPLTGWSMTKSVLSALLGVLVKEGRIALDDALPVPEWQGADDPRRRITLRQALQMSTGLRFNENYANPLADAPRMLFASPSAAAYAAAKPLAAEPGSLWYYSSGTSNILSYALRRVVGEADYPDFPRRALFDRIGMSSAVMEVDASGTFVGSSFMYATARDWARFGQLYLNDGTWRGERILPEGWVEFSHQPAPASERRYGAHFWRGVGPGYRCGSAPRPPADAFYALGFEGQSITIIPSRQLVVVRLGLTRHSCAWDQHEFLDRILRALPKAA
jgi:CubicO group peptidase (beta-lactamase class C family)